MTPKQKTRLIFTMIDFIIVISIMCLTVTFYNWKLAVILYLVLCSSSLNNISNKRFLLNYLKNLLNQQKKERI